MTASDFPLRAPTVYEPTVTGLPVLSEYFRSVWKRRQLAWHLARTDLKAEHYTTVLGQVWILLDPLLLAAVYYMVRTVIRPIGAGSDAAARSLLISHLIWAIFFFRYVSRSLQSGAKSVLAGKQLILNTSFPRAIFPLVAVLKAFLDFIPTLPVYLVLHYLLGQPFGTSLFFLPLIIFLLTLFNVGLAAFFAPLTVFFRDTSAFIPYMTQIWLYTTPVLYGVNEIPPNFKALLQWNPLFPFYAALEQVFGGRWPSTGYLFAAAAWAFGLLIVGGVVFLVRERDFAVKFSDDVAVRVEDLWVRFRTTRERTPTLKKSITAMAQRARAAMLVDALRGVSFEVYTGSVYGVIGHNGAGKSTLFRAIAGILPPTYGRITLWGRVTPLLSLGVGFNRELTGRENILLGGLAGGLTRAEVEEHAHEVEEFAGLGGAIDFPMRTYSSGMFGRLAFSVAAFLEPEILLIDEALSAGDAAFRRKSMDKIVELCERDCTVLIISHGLDVVKALADRSLWIEQGQVVLEGPSDEIVEAYLEDQGFAPGETDDPTVLEEF